MLRPQWLRAELLCPGSLVFQLSLDNITKTLIAVCTWLLQSAILKENFVPQSCTGM